MNDSSLPGDERRDAAAHGAASTDTADSPDTPGSPEPPSPASAPDQPEEIEQKPLPIPYTAEEVGRTFSAQLENFDFSEELKDLGIGVLSLIKRSQGTQQFTALSIALWKLALARSFPEDAENFFSYFLENSPLLTGDGKKAKKLRAAVLEYVELLAEKGDMDFSAIADHLVRALKLSGPELPRQRLKTSLRVRALYSFIFDKLI